MPPARRVAPFGNLRIYGRLAPPRNFSQLTTSFFASQSLGIHHVPLTTFARARLYLYLITSKNSVENIGFEPMLCLNFT